MLINHLDVIISILESTCWFSSLTRGIITSNLFWELMNCFIHTVVSPLWTVRNTKMIIYKKTLFAHVDPHPAVFAAFKLISTDFLRESHIMQALACNL